MLYTSHFGKGERREPQVSSPYTAGGVTPRAVYDAPRSHADQHVVQEALAAYNALRAGNASAVERFSELQARLERAAGFFHAMIDRAVCEAGLESHVDEVRSLPKDLPRTIEKALVRQKCGNDEPLPDLNRSRLHIKQGFSPAGVLDVLKHHFGLPDELPGGLAVREDKRYGSSQSNCESVAGFYGSYLNIPFEFEGQVYLGEVQAYDPEGLDMYNATRPPFVATRSARALQLLGENVLAVFRMHPSLAPSE